MKLNNQRFKKILEAGIRKNRGDGPYSLRLPGSFCVLGEVCNEKDTET